MKESFKIFLGLAVFISAVPNIIDACPESSVNLYLYNGKTGKNKPCKLATDSCPDFDSCGFDPNSRSVVVAHGWNGSYVGDCPKAIKNAYVDKMLQDDVHVNVILIDYAPCALDYSAVNWTKEIGEAAAKIVQHLANSCDLNLKIVECVGFSFGAHICGTFSAALTVRNKRITALDAFGPIISSYPPESKLDITDGDYVSCIHTSSQLLSITDGFCDCDIYSNGARNQPGCEHDTSYYQRILGICDHVMSCELFALSILYPNIFPLHKQCDTSYDALTSKCTKSLSTAGYLGEPNYGTRGIYWVNTTQCLEQHNELNE